MTHKVVLRPAAREDLKSIFDWVEGHSGPESARAYVQRIRDRYLALSEFSERGTPQDDLLPGLRTLTVERRVVIGYIIQGDTVVILRILHKGRDPARAFNG